MSEKNKGPLAVKKGLNQDIYSTFGKNENYLNNISLNLPCEVNN